MDGWWKLIKSPSSGASAEANLKLFLAVVQQNPSSFECFLQQCRESNFDDVEDEKFADSEIRMSAKCTFMHSQQVSTTCLRVQVSM